MSDNHSSLPRCKVKPFNGIYVKLINNLCKAISCSLVKTNYYMFYRVISVRGSILGGLMQTNLWKSALRRMSEWTRGWRICCMLSEETWWLMPHPTSSWEDPRRAPDTRTVIHWAVDVWRSLKISCIQESFPEEMHKECFGMTHYVRKTVMMKPSRMMMMMMMKMNESSRFL